MDKEFSITVDPETIQDAKNIFQKAYYPLTGFLGQADFQSVLDRMRLVSGQVWSMPVVFDITQAQMGELGSRSRIKLVGQDAGSWAVLDHIQAYPYDKKEFALKVFGTDDTNHPGVAELQKRGQYLVGGQVVAVDDGKNLFSEVNYLPSQTKAMFKERGWNTVVAFQTRNVPHRSHEALQKMALAKVDGIFVQPVIGKKKQGDFKDEVIIHCYKTLLEKYYPKDRSLLGILPIKMNYAGPREAVMHALIRRNYGCTHMIVGRNHAGVGNYYDAYAAHRVFDQFSKEELGIEILKFGDVSYCYICKDFVPDTVCPHQPSDRFQISGTKVRGMIQNKEPLPSELLRPEIESVINQYPSPFVG